MDEAGRDKLWKNYISTRSAEYRDELIVEYAQLVKLVAGRLNMYLGYNVEYDDLVGYGIFGLIDAIDKFDYGKNVKFETYASLRIRGAILDQIRKMDWIPRSLRQKQKRIEAAMAKIESETGHIASDEELAAELEITIDELADWQGKMKASNLISLDEYTEAGSEVKMESAGNSHFDQPEEAIEKEELKKMMVRAIDSLTEKERSVVVLYYYEDKSKRDNAWIYSAAEVSSSFENINTKKTDINKVDLDTLMQVKGVGRQIAHDIVNYRDKVGKISSMYELKSIPAVNDDVYKILCAQFTVTGSSGYYNRNESYGAAKVNLNNAQINQLLAVEGVTQELAENIILYRKNNGDFTSVSELLDVEGMSITLYNSISDKFTV